MKSKIHLTVRDKVSLIIAIVIGMILSLGFSGMYTTRTLRPFYIFVLFLHGSTDYEVDRITLMLRVLIIFICLMFGYLAVMYRQSFLLWCLRYRYVLGIAVIIFATVFQLNGSSLSGYDQWHVGSGLQNRVFGIPRFVRTDEWATFTPMIVSQEYGDNPYSWFSDIIRGTSTDVFVVYALPVKHIFSVFFRPFLTGFLLFGSKAGLGFYWSSRLVVLWLIYYELFRFLTKGKKLCAVIGATLVAWAPVVQWWFAINGFVEMLIFGALAVLLCRLLLTRRSRWIKLLCIFGLYICGGGYVMTFYPADMVPLAYLFGIMIIWVIVEAARQKQIRIDRWDAIVFFAMVVCLGLSLLFIFRRSGDSIQAVINTAYPGQRVSLGGDAEYRFFYPWADLFLGIKSDGVVSNQCNMATFFDLFPLGIVLTLYQMIRRKRADLLNILLYAVGILLAWYCMAGVPEIVAKVTLLSHATGKRAIAIVSLINVILLIRGLSELSLEGCSRWKAILAGLAFAVYATGSTYGTCPDYVSKTMLAVIAILAFLLLYLILRRRRYLFALLIAGMCVMLGGIVNPIQRGLGGATDSNLARTVQKIVEQDPDGLWICDVESWIMSDYLLMQGAPTIDSINVYPTMERWHILDPDGEYEDVYNRYAHITTTIAAETDMNFTLVQGDLFQLTLTPENLTEDLNVSYVLSVHDLTALDTDEVSFDYVDEADGYQIYRVEKQ